MKYNLLPNEIPTNIQLRREIRKKTEEYIKELGLLPPISYEILHKIASQLINQNQWNVNLQAFTMVCCGNALWRIVVGAIPHKRRILLLPQCLRHGSECKATQDEIGIICADCGKCSISGLLREAESLDYLAVITEGTTIASRLVESGKIDAVIGVGCMEVLQKMYSTVTKYAVPSIAIPLLSCGCINTVSDIEWIKEEINYYNKRNEIRLLNLNYLKTKSLSIFGEEQVAKLTNLGNSKPEQIAIEAILSGGQRLRPFLTLLTYEAFCTSPNAHTSSRLALSIECFHKASLIHDDIEDNDDFRYNKETLHKKYGISTAINTGDLLTGLGYRLISESDLPIENQLNCFKIIASGHCKLSIGQGAELNAFENNEILTSSENISVFLNKTSEAFRVALLMGAAAGGATNEILEILGVFCNYIGIAYQILDDLSDYNGKKGDIEFRRNSFVLSVLFDKLESDERTNFKLNVKNANFTSIYMLIDQKEVLKEVEEILVRNINQARESLNNLNNIGLKIALHEILGKVFKEYC